MSNVYKRFISTARTAHFKAQGINWFPLNKYPNSASASQKKWAPSNGDSFRSFAEYRLKVVNQSPLVVRSKSTVANDVKVDIKRSN